MVGAGRAGKLRNDYIRNVTILNMDTLEWREGPQFPKGSDYFLYPTLLENQDGNYGFTTFGGDDKWAWYMNSVLFYDDSSEEFSQTPYRSMHKTRSGATAFYVPDELADCHLY